MKIRSYIFFILISFVHSADYSQSNSIKERTKFFDKDLFQRHLDFLGSDLFEGRAPGTIGGNLAAKYLALEFDKFKLKPLGNNETYYQNIAFHGVKPLSSVLSIQCRDSIKNMNLRDDFLFYHSGEVMYFPKSVPLVFAGYGIVAPEFNYDDYKNIDVAGKIAVILEAEPISYDPSYFDGDDPTIYSLPDVKQRIALSKGAVGTILIPILGDSGAYNWSAQIPAFSFENLSLASSANSSLDILLNPANAEILFKESRYSVSDLRELHNKNKMESFPLNVQMTCKVDYQQRDFVSPNIIGMIEGSDPELKDSYIIVSAHYDHLGIGMPVNGDSIYNGVFDNAEGVSVVLEIARNFSEKHFVNKRSIIFLLTTAEESGLLGSYFYTINPAVPLYRTISNINIDGIASFDNFKSVIGVGTEYSTLIVALENVTRERGLKITSIPSEFASFGSFAKSDQHSFAKAGIPSILILEGVDYANTGKEEGLKKMLNYAANIYHSPSDDLNQKINFNAVAQHFEILSAVIEHIANNSKTPEWLDNSPFIKARKFSIEIKK